MISQRPWTNLMASSRVATLVRNSPRTAEVTVAVKVTDCPKTDGFALEVTAVDVVAWVVNVATVV